MHDEPRESKRLQEKFMTTSGESKFSRLIIGLGLGAMVGLMATILARNGRGKSLGYLNQLAAKLGDTAGVIVQQGKKLLGCKRDNSVEHSTAENQAYQEERRENLGG
jgi:hypothetical protein